MFAFYQNGFSKFLKILFKDAFGRNPLFGSDKILLGQDKIFRQRVKINSLQSQNF